MQFKSEAFSLNRLAGSSSPTILPVKVKVLYFQTNNFISTSIIMHKYTSFVSGVLYVVQQAKKSEPSNFSMLSFVDTSCWEKAVVIFVNFSTDCSYKV